MSAHVAAVVKACFAALSAGAGVLPCRKLCPPGHTGVKHMLLHYLVKH